MTVESDKDYTEIQPRYFIDLNCYQERRRSFASLASSRLCPACQKKKIPESAERLLHTIARCCAKWEEFLTQDMPLLEMVFRLLLANDNQPLALDQIQERLQQYLGNTNVRDISLQKLKRVIDNDRFYGLRPVQNP